MANYRALLPLYVLVFLALAPAAYGIHFSDGPRVVTPSDEMSHYGDEYWAYTGLHPTPAGVDPIFLMISPETGTPTITQSPDGDTVTIRNFYMEEVITVSTRTIRITVLNSGPYVIGVQPGDIIEHQSLSTRPMWYNLGIDKSFGQITGFNGYEDHGIFTLYRAGSPILVNQMGYHEHVWGNNLKKGLYQVDVTYEDYGVFVVRDSTGQDLMVGVLFQARTATETWQDGFYRFLSGPDAGVYHALGSTVSGSGYTVTDIGTKCEEFDIFIPSTSQGDLSVHLNPTAQTFPNPKCAYRMAMHDLSGTLGSQDVGGRIAWETQRKTVALPTSPIATSLTINTSPNPSREGEMVTVTGLLTDSAGNRVGGRSVAIQFSIDGVTWTRVASVTTASDGSYSFQGKGKAGTYQVRSTFAGDSTYAASTSNVVTHVVNP